MANVFGIRKGNPAKLARDKRDAELSAITWRGLPDYPTAQVYKWEVLRGTSLIGFVEQFKPERGTIHPCKAMPLQWNRQTVLAGAFYGARAFQDAVDAIA